MSERNIFRPAVKVEVDEELSFHVEMRVRELMASGLTVNEARAEAVRRFGDIEEVRTACRRLGEERDRKVRRGTLLSELRQDVMYGVRMLRRAPGYTAIAVLTLALGIGATTAIFSMVHAVLLRSQPFPEAERIVVPETLHIESGDRSSISYGDYEDWRDASVFEHVAIFGPYVTNVTGGAQPERLAGARVSPGFFESLGVVPAHGRNFDESEYAVGVPSVTVIAHELAQGMFGSAAGALGQKLEVGGRPMEVVGVLPPRMAYPSGSQMWTPMRITPEELESNRRRDNFIFLGIARMRTDRTLAQTKAELARLAHAASTHERRSNVSVTATPLTTYLVGNSLIRGLWLILGAVVFVLLIGCVNLANLMTSRAAARQRELSIRTALGASRARLARQLLTESGVLAIAGGLVGILLAWFGVRALIALAPAQLPRIGEAGVDGTVLGFALLATVASVLLFGLLPAVFAARGDSTTLRDDDGRVSGSRRARMVRSTLVAAELALSVLLLVGAGLFVRSFAEARGIDPGVRTSGLLTFNIGLQGERYSDQNLRPVVYEDLLARLRRIPGVTHAAVASALPLGGGGFYLGRVFLQDGSPEPPAGPETAAEWVVASSDYFATADIDLVRGRTFDTRDGLAATQVAIISRAFAKAMFGDEDPLGKRVRSWRDENIYREIIGVVDDVRFFGADDEIRPLFYVPYAQSTWGSMMIMLRTDGEPAALAPAARAAVRDLDPTLAIGSIRTGEEIMSSTLAPRRFAASLVGGFAALALLLAVTGVYGVLSYNVAQRRREIGIRMALGAGAGGVARMVVGEALVVLVAGLAIGLAGAAALSKLLGSLLYGVTATDPLTYAGAAGVLLLVALTAAVVPARAAARVDPMRTIR